MEIALIFLCVSSLINGVVLFWFIGKQTRINNSQAHKNFWQSKTNAIVAKFLGQINQKVKSVQCERDVTIYEHEVRH